MLLVLDDDRYAPIRLTFEKTAGWFVHAGPYVAERFRNERNLKVTLLRHLHSRYEEDRETHLCEIEVHSPEFELPLDAFWFTRQQLEDLDLVGDSQRPFLSALLIEDDTGTPESRPPWERKGWYQEAVDWIDANVARTGDVVQIKAAWSCSSILRIPVGDESLYFKANYDKPPGEVALTSALASRWPRNFPKIVASDAGKGWMLMEDFGDDRLISRPDEDWGKAAACLAKIQLACSKELDRWLDLGCPIMGPHEIPGLLREVADFSKPNLEPDEYTRYMDDLPTWDSWWTELFEMGIPLSLHQQDFREGNLIASGDTFTFYDWADTVVSHPFFSIQRMLDYIARPDTEKGWDGNLTHPEDSKRRSIRDAYLSCWTEVGDPEQLLAAFVLSRRLNISYQALRWYLESQCLEHDCPWGMHMHGTVHQNAKRMIRVKTECLQSTTSADHMRL